MSIYKKLFEAKKEIGAITKDAKNPFFKSNYFDINSLLREVEPILTDKELLLLQPILNSNVYTKIVDTETGEEVNSSMQLPNIQDPQKLGSAITYYRRYTLQSLLGLQAEDDDGNKAQKQVVQERKQALTDSQFESSKNGTKSQIQTVLDKYRMSATQRDELKLKLK